MKRFLLFKLLLAIALPLLLTSGLQAQNRKVTGKVTDSQGEVMIGVSVVVVGTPTLGTTTDLEGNYTLTVPAQSTLSFSYMGYETLEEKVNGRSTVNVTMTEDAVFLDDVVVVGYGVQRKSDVAGSVTSIKAEEMLTYPASTTSELLRGLSAGVQVSSSSGAPGSSSSIQIRGVRSLTAGNDPLYVIDGVPSSATEFNAINVNDVESVEILKDAAAQAIYGARAANGVILVTTKRGKAGKAEVSFSSTVSVQTLWKNFEFYEPEEWAELRRWAVAGDLGLDDLSLVSDELAFQDTRMLQAWREGQWTDWEDLMFKPAVMQQYSLGVRGGTQKMRVSTNLGYLDHEGMVTTGSNYKRGNFRTNLDYDVNKWLSLGVNMSATKTSREAAAGTFNTFITRPPYGLAYDENGKVNQYINSSNDKNPIYDAPRDHSRTDVDIFRVNFFLDLKPFKGFSYRFNATEYARFAQVGGYKDSDYTGGGAGGSLSNSRNYNYVIENIINYQVPIANKNHRLNLTAVQSWDRTYNTSLEGEASDIPVDSFLWEMIGDGTPVSIGRSVSENILVSYLFRAQYNFKDRYIINAAVRRDGSSRMKNHRWGTFPSVSAAWRISQEPFMKEAKNTVSNLKLRLSYGMVGNQSGIGNYTTLGTTAGYEMEFGDHFLMGYLPGSTLPNPNIKWETTASTNFGLDFGLFKNRLNGTIEYYLTDTYDLLVSRQIESVLGYTSMLDNLGQTHTNGLEITLDADVFRTKKFTWNIGANFSTYDNKIVRIDNRVDEEGKALDDVGNRWFIGHPINVYYTYETAGIIQKDDVEMVGGKYQFKPNYDSDGDGVPDAPLKRDDAVDPGKIMIVDRNQDGIINADDRYILPRDPKFIVSLNTTLRYKSLDLFMDWYSVQGVVKSNAFLYDPNSGGSLQGKQNGIKVNYWTPDNPSNEFPRPMFNSNTTYHSSLGYQDASYIRLRTLSLGYTMSKSVSDKLGIGGLRLALTATNLLTFTKFLSYSPEFSAGGYPEAKQYALSLNVSF